VTELVPIKIFSAAQEAGAPYSCTTAWLQLCRVVYNYDTRAFLLKKDGNEIGGFCCAVVRSALFGTRIISMPFSDEPGLWLKQGITLSEEDRSALESGLARELDALAAETGAGCSELRGAAPAAGGFTETAPYLRLVLDLARPYKTLRQDFHTNLIKNLRKADKTVTVREARGPGAFTGAYNIYLTQMRLFGSPPLPAAHFESLMGAGLGRLFIASVGGADAALLFAIVRGGIFYADVNAALPAYDNSFPKVRLFDETIRLACSEGLRVYDFMRTRAGTGVHEHKKKWGGTELPVKYFFKTYGKNVKVKLDPEEGRFALPRLLLRHAPLSLLKAVGPAIRRHAGK
jgi:hypothetical protein